jgi:hypothetical protein
MSSREPAARLASTAAAVQSAALAGARHVAAQGRGAQALVFSILVTCVYVVLTPPTALWRALSGVDFLLGVVLLATWVGGAAVAQLWAHPARGEPNAAASAAVAVRDASLLDVLANIAAPWVALALGYKAAAPFCAPNAFFVILGILGRSAAAASFPVGARYASPLAAAAFDAARGASLLGRAVPVHGAVLNALQLLGIASWCHAAFRTRLGAELPALASVLRAAPLASQQAKRGLTILRRHTEEPPGADTPAPQSPELKAASREQPAQHVADEKPKDELRELVTPHKD